MSELDDRAWVLLEEEADLLPLLTRNEALAVIHLLGVLSKGVDFQSAGYLKSVLKRRLPAD